MLTQLQLPCEAQEERGEVAFDHVRKVFPDGTVAVQDLSLEIADGELMVFVGPSGCGKTTALRMVAGLEHVSEGEIRIDSEVVNSLPPRERDVAMVFQNYALYPHKTVFENLAFPLKLRKFSREEIDRKVGHIARLLELEEQLKRRPRQLSGGQRQRVAMGRAIIREPRAFLMDEPLSNLDAKLRAHMRAEISLLHKELGVTMIFVTHDQVEAMTLGQRVAVMRKGELQQVAARRSSTTAPPTSSWPASSAARPSISSRASWNATTAAFTSQSGSIGWRSTRSRSLEPNGLRPVSGVRSCSACGPEHLEDAALAPGTPDDRRLDGSRALAGVSGLRGRRPLPGGSSPGRVRRSPRAGCRGGGRRDAARPCATRSAGCAARPSSVASSVGTTVSEDAKLRSRSRPAQSGSSTAEGGARALTTAAGAVYFDAARRIPSAHAF